MKKLTIFLFIIIGFLGCGNGSSKNSNEAEEINSKVENIVTEELNCDFYTPHVVNKTKYFEVINNQETLDLFVTKLNNLLYERNVSKVNIDFTNYRVLVYITKYNAPKQIDDYIEAIKIEENQSVTIEQVFTRYSKQEGKYCGIATQVRLYKVANSIKNIKMIHEDEVSTIDMDNPMKKAEQPLVNIYTKSHGQGKRYLKVFDTNLSFQNFISNDLTITKSLLQEEINFEKYRVLLVANMYGNQPHINRIEELITYPNTLTAKIEQKRIIPKDIECDVVSLAMEIITRIYKVKREIETVEIKHLNDNLIEVNMNEI